MANNGRIRRAKIDWRGLVPRNARKVCDISRAVRAKIMALPEARLKFESMYQAAGSEDCWPWIRSASARGYGHFCVGKIRLVATRVSWEIYKGAIPEGLHVLHKCDNPPCVNPNHLFLGTAKDNIADMVAKGRVVTPDVIGEANSAAILTETDVRAIRRSKATGVALANKYGVAKTTISAARCGDTWAHITDVAPLPKQQKGARWTGEDKSRIIRMAGKVPAKEIATVLKRTVRSLYMFTSREGISLRMR